LQHIAIVEDVGLDDPGDRGLRVHRVRDLADRGLANLVDPGVPAGRDLVDPVAPDDPADRDPVDPDDDLLSSRLAFDIDRRRVDQRGSNLQRPLLERLACQPVG
jgi:hypothetical protein